jgi:alkylhydroperoxidase/carboxymuconolactone decarboxylase family protein YurZ
MTWSLAIIKEALLHTAIYTGVPAANTGFNIASEELEKRQSSQPATDHR